MQHLQQARFETETRLQLQDTIQSIIGGNSFCYLNLQVGGGEGGWISDPTIICNGKYPMYDVAVRLYDPDDFAVVQPGLSMQEFLAKDLFSTEVGNMGVGQARPFPLTRKINLRDVNQKVLRAQISARNGFFSEDILLKKVGEHWLRAIRIFKGFSSDQIHEWADQEFPRDANGKVQWAD